MLLLSFESCVLDRSVVGSSPIRCCFQVRFSCRRSRYSGTLPWVNQVRPGPQRVTGPLNRILLVPAYAFMFSVDLFVTAM